MKQTQKSFCFYNKDKPLSSWFQVLNSKAGVMLRMKKQVKKHPGNLIFSFVFAKNENKANRVCFAFKHFRGFKYGLEKTSLYQIQTEI